MHQARFAAFVDRPWTQGTYSDTSGCCLPSGRSCPAPGLELKCVCREPGIRRGTSSIRQMPMPKQSFRSGCIKATLVSCGRLRTHWPGSVGAGSACARSASAPLGKPAWRPCPGHISAGSVRNGRAPEEWLYGSGGTGLGVSFRVEKSVDGHAEFFAHRGVRIGGDFYRCQIDASALCTECAA